MNRKLPVGAREWAGRGRLNSQRESFVPDAVIQRLLDLWEVPEIREAHDIS